MKGNNLKLFILLVSCLLSYTNVLSQFWGIAGNTGTNPTTDYVGTTDNRDLRFRTNNTFRMGITDAGWLGLNTTNPSALFHMDQGNFLITGSSALSPALGSGTRLIWDGTRRFFRAGLLSNDPVTAVYWDPLNCGEFSFAFGEDLLVNNNYSFAFGNDIENNGLRTIGFGVNLDLSGGNSFIAGGESISNGVFNFGFGHALEIQGNYSYALGCDLENIADFAFVLGSGVINTADLLNDIDNSMMVGFNSDIPTLFVGPSDGLGTFGNVGIGNVTMPTQVLDVNGTARLRQMPDTLPDVLITGFEEDTIGDYTLTYLAFTGNNGQVLAGDGTWVNNGNCEWNLQTNFGNNDLVMGYTGACNEGRVGIGTSTPFLAKAHIFQNQSGIGNPSFGLWSQAEGNTTEIRGVFGTAEATGPNTAGGTIRVAGVEGLAIGTAPNCTYQLVGIYGRTNPIGGSCNNTLAGLFEGDIQVTGMLLPSDETLKENVQTIENASDILGQITPRSYTYKTEEFPGLGLASGTHYGVMAQEIEQILPDAVKSTIGTKSFSEDGMTPEEYVEFTGVYYTEFIPLLIQSHKEQEVKINQLQDQVNQLADLINQCCSPDAKSNEQGQGMNEFEMEITPFKSDLSPNFPNPFERVTQINYAVGCQCEAQIIVFDQLGQQIEVLKSGSTNPGTYSIQWDASNLESGIYFISLLVDGQTFVQQAVKI